MPRPTALAMAAPRASAGSAVGGRKPEHLRSPFGHSSYRSVYTHPLSTTYVAPTDIRDDLTLVNRARPSGGHGGSTRRGLAATRITPSHSGEMTWPMVSARRGSARL